MKKIKIKWLIMALIACLLVAIATRLPIFTGDSTEQLLKNPLFDSELLNIIVRKTVHVVAFGIIAILFMLSFWNFKHKYIIGWFFGTCYGAMDEWHQTFVPNRDGIFTDVLYDSAGAILALLCFHIVYTLAIKRKKSML